MEKKIYWGVAAIIVVIFLADFFIPQTADTQNLLPWHIEHLSANETRVFGVTLNQTSVNEAEQLFKENAKVSMFHSTQGQLAVEAYFEEIALNGLKAKMVVTFAVPETDLKAMFDRSIRAQGVGSGKQITLTTEDVSSVRKMPINGITYMPSINLDEEVFTQRFGIPTQRIKETESGVIHWLYENHGLDITFDGSAKPILQYVAPADFAKLRDPLLASGTSLD